LNIFTSLIEGAFNLKMPYIIGEKDHFSGTNQLILRPFISGPNLL
jgi:hypothetical protein